MTVSVIIATKTWPKSLEECIVKCRELDYPDFEIIILPDSEGVGSVQRTQGLSPSELNSSFPKGTVPIEVISTGSVSPAHKRDIALKYAKGEILAFIDADAYPEKDWLKNALENFTDPEVAAVGGPAITPPEDNRRQEASGLVYASFLVSAKFSHRYVPKNRQQVDDYPSCNFLVRKSLMQELGGFQTNFWPGEDTKLCLDITKKLKKKIIYDPQVIVYHHRRPLFLPHLRQVASYALHRGYFVRRYPQTSLRVSYFIPSIFLLFIITGWVFPMYFYILSTYLLLAIIFSIVGTAPQRGLSLRVFLILWVFCGIILTHLAYGFYFLKGLLSPKLKEECSSTPIDM